jgi:hypothetical protein
MDELDGVLSMSTHLLGEGCASLLAGHARITHLLHLIQQWQPADHLLAGELSKRLEVQVPKACVPAQGRIVALGRETHGSANLEVEDVES